MTRDINKLAREAKMPPYMHDTQGSTEALERFADLAVKQAVAAIWKPSWEFVEAALLKEYNRMKYAQDMFPQVAEEIRQSRNSLLEAIQIVRFARERNFPLPEVQGYRP